MNISVKSIYRKVRQLLMLILDATLIKPLRYIESSVDPYSRRIRVVDEIWSRAARSSADYVQQHMKNSLIFDRVSELRSYSISQITIDGLAAEFGVADGQSINYLAKHYKRTIYGFDSFEGLKEDWKGHSFRKGMFNRLGKLPSVLPNVVLVKGWFDESLPGFLAKNGELFSYIHFDADTYESTSLILKLVGSRITKGTVIAFDEYMGYPGWLDGEYRAWQEFVSLNGLAYEYLGFSNLQVVIIVK